MAKKLDRFSFDFDMYNNLSNHFISTEYDVTNRLEDTFLNILDDIEFILPCA
jgi:hypothetical protein